MRILIIAGPNGAGKTSFAQEFLPAEGNCAEFVNADNIAAGLSPFRPDAVAWQAGRLMLERIRHLSRCGIDFAFETTLSTRSYLPQIREWQAAGARVELHFLKLPDADWAVRRVAERVRFGGHVIPEATIRRRYARGWRNFSRHYQGLVDTWTLYDSCRMPPRVIDSGHNDRTGAVEERQPSYDARPQTTAAPKPGVECTPGGLAALTRAAEKAVARARAADLEPVVRFADREENSTGIEPTVPNT